ncbi:histidinol dehydrogenase [Mesoterricola sediminis]|uniref:Histidinol dehydrogenase n=1 Tax=Mesoterricola sediminis TaxID=2927980 RepID=A0AA48GUG9_9BACT|nr:histidinol dehydrogenase [Mesoterricola sediminis]BDU75865.1 histidinol dehydrogenase [Mesoterricola sediminis]
MLTILTLGQALERASRAFPAVPPEVPVILEDIRAKGDAAVFAWAAQLDAFTGGAFEVPAARLKAAPDLLDPALRAHLEAAVRRVDAFARAQMAAFQPLELTLEGMRLGHRAVPVSRAACYAPGGRYPLPSSVIMGVVPARVAGVKEVVVLSPRLHPVTLAAAALAGADRVFDLGGVHGVAAAAWGLAGVPRVDLIAGPGNRFVTGAKRLLYGDVGIDFPAGPSELLVVADGSADPALVAADLLAQAEHDPDALPMLATFDGGLVPRVAAELERQLALLPAGTPAAESLRQGFAVVLGEGPEADADAVTLADALAPEHLELQGPRAEALAGRFSSYGSLFVGADAAEVFGDYGSGTNHILPTSGAARYTGGVSVATFLKLLTWQRTLPEGREALAAQAAAIADAEGLAAHAASARLRAGRSLA